MASVVLVKELLKGSQGGLSVGGQDGLEVRKSRTFSVETSAPVTETWLLQNTWQLPYVLQPHPENLFCLCKSIQASQVSTNFWEVVCEYDNKPNNGGNQDNPLLEEPEINWEPIERKEPIPVEYGAMSVEQAGERVEGFAPIDTAILTSAGEIRTNPPVMHDVWDIALTITRNEPTFDGEKAMAYQGAVNSDQFYNAKPGQVRLFLSAQSKKKNNMKYYTVKYKFVWRFMGHDLRLLDAGSYYKEDGKKILFKDERGNCIPNGLLNGAGGKLPDGQPAMWKEYKVCIQQPFGVLNMPPIN